MPQAVRATLVLERDGVGQAGHDRIDLLQAIDEAGSISGAGRRLGLSYRGAWNGVQCLNGLFDTPLVSAATGGRGGGSAALTEAGRRVLLDYRVLRSDLQDVVARLQRQLAVGGEGGIPRGARWTAEVTRTEGPELELATSRRLSIVAHRLEEDGAQEVVVGGRVNVHIPAQAVLLALPGIGRTSARNCWPGRVTHRTEAVKGVEVKLDLATGDQLCAVVTRRSADALGLHVGATACALVKASQIEVEPA